MSCNTCQNRPCNCPDANCSCPPDYSFNPATLTCQGTTCESTLPTSCIFSTSALNCIKTPINTDLQTILTAMDTKICQCGSCSGNTDLPLFYVDSNNIVNGDGSVGNPFKTIDLCYTAIIGSGTIDSPDFPSATIYVMGGQYSTGANIYIPTTNWTFFNGAVVTFTGTGFFIDSSVTTIEDAAPFSIFGYLNWQCTTVGGFLHNFGSYTSTNHKSIYIEALKIISDNVGAQTLIQHAMVGGSGIGRITTNINMRGLSSVLGSAAGVIFNTTSGSFYVDLGGGVALCGVHLLGQSGSINTVSNIVSLGGTDSIHPELSRFVFKNGYIGAGIINTMMYMTGKFSIVRFENLVSVEISTNLKATYFMELASNNADAATSSGQFEFLLLNNKLDSGSFTASNIIHYVGTDPVFNYLQMQNNILYNPCTIDFSNFALGAISMGTIGVSGYNIINGQTHFYGLPTASVGSGFLYNSSGTIKIG